MRAVGKKYFDSAAFVHLAMAFSMLRPELQGFVGQNTTPPMPVNMAGYPQNFTGVAFAPSSTSNMNFHLAVKEADYNNPLSEFLEIHTTGHNQFHTDAVAMLFNGENHAPRETRTSSFSTEIDSGYSSDGGRSPSALSSVGGSPHHEASFGNVQTTTEDDFFGAAGFTPTEEDLLKSLDFELEDYIDLDSIYDGPPAQKKALLSEELPYYPNIKTEPLPSPDDTYGRKFPNFSQDISSDPNRKNPLEDPFNLDGFEDQFYNPFSIDFTATNEELQESATEVGSAFDFDSFADNLDYTNDLPLDVFDPRPEQGQTQTVESKHDSLLPLGQEPLPIFSEATAARNDSGFPSTESSLTRAISGEWLGASAPLLSSASIKQEKPDIGSISSPSTSTSTRFIPTKAPKDFTASSKPAIAASAGASRFPASEDEVVDMSISEFSSFLETLSDPDAQKARDIRRRGKNKAAARLCRKRKIEVVSDIEEDLDTLRQRKEDGIKERKKLQAETAFYKNKINELQDNLFKSLRDDSGRPLSSKEYSLFQGANGSIYVGKNIDAESKKKKQSDAK